MLYTLNLVDDYSRECVGQIVDTSISGERLTRYLDELGQTHTLPQTLVCDNGSELASKAIVFLVTKDRGKVTFYPIRRAHAERLYGELQCPISQSLPKSALVPGCA